MEELIRRIFHFDALEGPLWVWCKNEDELDSFRSFIKSHTRITNGYDYFESKYIYNFYAYQRLASMGGRYGLNHYSSNDKQAAEHMHAIPFFDLFSIFAEKEEIGEINDIL